MKHVTLDQFLTADELRTIAKMWKTGSQLNFAHRVCKQIIEPNMARINKSLGQANDPMYLAYCVEYVCIQLERKYS